ncbi:MAG: MscS Mechanosensitive ion channel [Vampirovibrio sp.]|jgi:small-conductance mechanosensitive channel|nr:MscS Mechanosensitive ion channel [Vampirovibrio sp.]
MQDPMAKLWKSALPLLDWRLWIGPSFFVTLGVVGGLVVEKLLLGTIRRVLTHTSIELNEHIASIVRGVIFWLFTLWGVYMATFCMPFLAPSTVALIRMIVFIVAMLLSIRLLAKVAVTMVRFYLSRNKQLQALPNTSIFENIIRIAVYVFGIIMLLQTLGISVVPLITALGVGGLAVSLALQDTLANMFAGIQMILARQIRVGNTVQLENGLSGRVEDIGWRTTTMRQLSGNLVILPNSKLASNIIVNYTNPHPDLTVSFQMTVPLTADLEKVEAVAMEVGKDIGLKLLAEKNPGKKPKEFIPQVRFVSYGESWINMAINLPFTLAMDGGLVKHELFKALHARFVAENISLPFPQNIVHLDMIRSEAVGGLMAKLGDEGQPSQ